MSERTFTVAEARDIWLNTASSAAEARMAALAADRERCRAWAAAIFNPNRDRRS